MAMVFCTGENERHADTDGGCDIGIGLFDAAFGQDGCDAGKEC